MSPSEREALLDDARLLRRGAKLLAAVDVDPNMIAVILRIADLMQNKACGFQAPAEPYDTPPTERERRKEDTEPVED
jgi:hypothetical protein